MREEPLGQSAPLPTPAGVRRAPLSRMRLCDAPAGPLCGTEAAPTRRYWPLTCRCRQTGAATCWTAMPSPEKPRFPPPMPRLLPCGVWISMSERYGRQIKLAQSDGSTSRGVNWCINGAWNKWRLGAAPASVSTPTYISTPLKLPLFPLHSTTVRRPPFHSGPLFF